MCRGKGCFRRVKFVFFIVVRGWVLFKIEKLWYSIWNLLFRYFWIVNVEEILERIGLVIFGMWK